MSDEMTRRTLLASIGAAGLFPPFASALTAPPPAMGVALQVALRIGEPRSAHYGWREAAILDGSVTGDLMQGTVQSGQLRWLVDPASGAVEVIAQAWLLRVDGTRMALRDRTVHRAEAAVDLPGLPTAPRLVDVDGAALPHPPLHGTLDCRDLARGRLMLRALERRP